MGMVGGGSGAFIGAVHRMAAQLDGSMTLAAGALSSDPDRARASGRDLGLPDDRAYGTWMEMLEREAARPEDDRIDVVSIVTPNHVHHDVARAALEAGFHVVCDKPMVITLEDAQSLVETVERTGGIFGVTYNYTGYPMVKEARQLVADGAIGAIRRVHVEYHQGWLATALEQTGQKQAGWRTDPKLAGAGALGDIGSHAENLLTTITGLEIESLCADVSTMVPGRAIDDDVSVLLRLAGGARGVLTASQICVGRENDLSIRIYGETGTLGWRQEQPNRLELQRADGPVEWLTRGGPGMRSASAAAATRLPSGHPEGFIEAFANIYRGVADAIHARRRGETPTGLATEFPTVHDGARGVRFIHSVLASSAANAAWTAL